jgi:hypothetical protein
MCHFRLLFHILLRKHDYVHKLHTEGNNYKGVFQLKQKIIKSRLTFKINDTSAIVSIIYNYVSIPIKIQLVHVCGNQFTNHDEAVALHQSTTSLFQQSAIATYNTHIYHHPLGTSLQHVYQ